MVKNTNTKAAPSGMMNNSAFILLPYHTSDKIKENVTKMLQASDARVPEILGVTSARKTARTVASATSLTSIMPSWHHAKLRVANGLRLFSRGFPPAKSKT
jgi:hypothetical protein